jgi:hypothetical protein
MQWPHWCQPSSCRRSSSSGRRELDSREGDIASWEDGLAAFERALGRLHIERNTKCVQAEAAHQDFLSQKCTSSSRYKQLIDLNQTLEECHILL